MAPHLTAHELDRIIDLSRKGWTTVDIHSKLSKEREKQGTRAPDPTTVRRAVRGATHRRGVVETRGAKKKLKPSQVRRIDRVRKEMLQKAKGEYEVHISDVMAKARIGHVTMSTVSKHLKSLGVSWRTPREAPLRQEKDFAERVGICSKWKRLPNNYFTEKVDGILDNKRFDIPTHARGKQYTRMRRVRGHLRTRAEGITKACTKPKSNKTKVNPGSYANVCAVIVKDRVRVWQYLPDRWCGDAAADLYKGPIITALKKYRGEKASYTIVEDNDPTGYKSNLAKEVKRGLSIKSIDFPRYSPDLNPLDYFLWNEVGHQMAQQSAPPRESVEAYKARLRKTALAIHPSVVSAAVAQMKSRAAEVVEAGGGRIRSD